MTQAVNSSVRKSALIPAAGFGTRVGAGPKCLLRIGQQSLLDILFTTIQPLVDEVLVAVPAELESEIAVDYRDKAVIVRGGKTRQDSVDRLFQASNGDVVLIQDVARPFASERLVSAVIEAAIEYGAAGAFLEPNVPVGRASEDKVATYLRRDQARIFQAPQAFTREVYMAARRETATQQFQSTAQMVMDAGFGLHAIPGEAGNIKITTPLDWQIATKVIAPTLGLE